MTRLRAALTLLRPSHWVKNTFVLAGIFFAGGLLNLGVLVDALFAFVAFCLASSAIYALNDIFDREADRKHPRKLQRPVASGSISVSQAIALSLACGVGALILSARISTPLFAVIAAYLLINTAYSRWLKHVVLVDVFCIASGFLLRLMAGTWGIDIPPSQWFVLCTFLLSLFLGFSKRYAERMDHTQDAAHKRAVVEDYSPEFLRMLLAVTLACTLIVYGLYTVSPQTLELHGTGDLVYTLPFVAFALFRYLYLVMQKGFGENLSAEFLRDPWLLASGAAYMGMAAYLIF